MRDWVVEEYGLDASKFVRPFYPNGDYENYDYPDDCVVVDNPPFSILAQIIQFYLDYEIKFFLFGHRKTLLSLGNYPCCFIITKTNITYENGAVVGTSFVTNLEKSGIRTAPLLQEKVKNTEILGKKCLPKYEYPPEVLTFTNFETLCNSGVDIKVNCEDLRFIRSLDEQRKCGKQIFGGGFLMSEQATARVNQAKKEKVKNPVIKWQLSERERAIIDGLGKSKI